MKHGDSPDLRHNVGGRGVIHALNSSRNRATDIGVVNKYEAPLELTVGATHRYRRRRYRRRSVSLTKTCMQELNLEAGGCRDIDREHAYKMA
jgi:hypothetical protein